MNQGVGAIRRETPEKEPQRYLKTSTCMTEGEGREAYLNLFWCHPTWPAVDLHERQVRLDERVRIDEAIGESGET
jgi:hypothetical protein